MTSESPSCQYKLGITAVIFILDSEAIVFKMIHSDVTKNEL